MAIIAINPGAERAASIAASLTSQIAAATDQFGDDLAGFALVVWDMRGQARTAYQTEHGPVAFALMPAFAHDALNRHVAVKLAALESGEEADGA